MEQVIRPWGNSLGIRLPKAVLEAARLSANDRVELEASPEGIIMRKAVTKKHRTLRERLETFYGCPIEEIPRISEPEFDWGEPRGEEVW